MHREMTKGPAPLADDQLQAAEPLLPHRPGEVLNLFATTQLLSTGELHSCDDAPTLSPGGERDTVVDTEAVQRLELPGRYQDAGPIGRGGMGEVRAILDATLRREVAAKTLDRGLARRPGLIDGFVEEAQITAQLEHPNIVPVHDLASDLAGTLYFTMKRVHGQTLQALLQNPDLQPGTSERLSVGLEVFLKVCDAVAFAHSRGVLHRDIKPANIMVGAFGQVYLMDWGLARVHVAGQGVVNLGHGPAAPASKEEGMVGTPGYLSPEMASKRFELVDERADVFGLGAVLYQIVTGRPPFEGDTVEEVLERTAACSFLPPEEDPDVFVPRALARVIERAMARDPGHRQATVGELAKEVRDFLHRGMHLPRQTFEPGQTIVREGEIGTRAYIVTRGKCDAYKTINGVRRVLRTMGPGSLFGESAILGAAPRSATVEATTRVAVLVLDREVLEESFSPDTWEGLFAKTLVERFRELDAQVTSSTREAQANVAPDGRSR
jgi:eukaryotic-like serine/threonine-protein kinase